MRITDGINGNCYLFFFFKKKKTNETELLSLLSHADGIRC